MANYIKVSKEVAERLGLSGIRNKTADGNYILWQSDVLQFSGDTLQERANVIGGVVITPNVAIEEIKGTKDPIKVGTQSNTNGNNTNKEEEKA